MRGHCRARVLVAVRPGARDTGRTSTSLDSPRWARLARVAAAPLVLLACTPRAASEAPARVCEVASADHAMPGPARGPARRDAPARNAACEGCHSEIAGEWRRSLHHLAYTEPTYVRALAREPTPFCRGCHAPEADPSKPAPRALATLGVGCVSCHAPAHADLARDAVWAAPGTTTAPHAVVRSAAFAGVPACAGCHEFDFADQPGMTMQRTAQEHAASRFAARSCADCHMPAVGEGAARHRSHVFAGSRDPALLRSALTISATRTREGLTLQLTPAAVGHAMPTGDLFRRLWISAEGSDRDGEVVTRDARALARHFARRKLSDLHTRKVELADDRPGASGPAPTIVRLDLGPASEDLQIRWRVLHQRVEVPLADDAAIVAGEIEIAAGTLPPFEVATP